MTETTNTVAAAIPTDIRPGLFRRLMRRKTAVFGAAVTVSTPSVIRWRAATGRPSPPSALATTGAPAASAVQPKR